MEHSTRFVLIAVFLGASLVASGAVGRASVTDTSDVEKYMSVVADAYMASMQAEIVTVGQFGNASQATPKQPEAVAYFPAQYVLDAPAGTSEPISTF
jgi:hypothetical protein